MTTKESTQPGYERQTFRNPPLSQTLPSPSGDCALTTPDPHRLTLWWSPVPFKLTEEGTRLNGAHETGPQGVARETQRLALKGFVW